MTRLKQPSVKRLLAGGAILCLIPSLAIAQLAGGKERKARADGERSASQGAKGSPNEMAAKMLADHDRNKDAELKLDELTAAVAAQRQQRSRQQDGIRGRQQSGRAGQQGPGDGRKRGAGKGKQGNEKGEMQRQRRGPGQKSAGQDKPKGKAQGEQRRPAGRDTDPAQMATKLIADFDKNGSDGLDVQELKASITAQRQNRRGKGGAEAGGTDGKAGREKAEGNRRRKKGNSAEAGEGKGPDQGRQKKGKAKAEKDTSEPGAGVVPKRPGE